MNNQIIALAQHLELPFFQYDGEYYTGATIEDFNSFSGSNYSDTEEIPAENEPFQKWIDETCTKLEDEITVSAYDDNTLEYGDEEYLIVDDETADDLWEQKLDYYLEELIYPELTGNLKHYFDDEAWKADARHDGRAYSLSSYDGNEDIECVYTEFGKETYFFIYRVN